MNDRWLLDTGVFIDVERGRLDLGLLVNYKDDYAVATVTVAELLEGVERADSDKRRTRRMEFVDDVLAAAVIEDYVLATARVHARLLAHVSRTGTTRGVHDLIIAATAVATDRVLITTDAKADFKSLPGVRARLID